MSLWKHTGIYDLLAPIAGVAATGLVVVAILNSPLGPVGFPRSLLVINALLVAVLLIGMRLTRRVTPKARARESDTSGPPLNPCPQCGSATHRSRGKRIDQRIRKRFTSLRPFRCLECEWRGWLRPRDPATGPGVLAHAVGTPDLSLLDRQASNESSAPRQSFSPKDLR